MKMNNVQLSEGSGGKEMQELIKSFNISYRGEWKNFDNDSATFALNKNKILVFTTDSYVVDPIFFPDADIGHLAFCGTVNDLSVMGAKPIGLSLSFVIEEGFPKSDLKKIIHSINSLSLKTKIPVVTGDTKVMEKSKIDKIIINTSGIGIAKELLTKKLCKKDKIIISGGIGEHSIALLSKRFDYQTSIVSDSKPIYEEISRVRHLIKIAKDPTRGGIASILNEICEKNSCGMLINEESIPAKEEVKKVSEMLGISLYELASEGRFVCISSEENAKLVESELKKFNKEASIIGEITEGSKVILQTRYGKRILQTPQGRIVPRIC